MTPSAELTLNHWASTQSPLRASLRPDFPLVSHQNGRIHHSFGGCLQDERVPNRGRVGVKLSVKLAVKDSGK